jgi:NADPH:quinone reductase-like Zn-dependent oxidoreductase
MRAAVYRRHGGIEVLTVEDVPEPVAAAGEVLVEVRAAALNRLDVLQRQGPPVVPGFGLPHIAGMDIAGEVVALGPGVDGVRVGSRVLVNPSIHCGHCEECLRGDDGLCPNVRVVGGSLPGGYGERVAVPATHVYPIPDGVDYVHAATIPTAFATVWHALLAVGELQAGETILLHAAGSGLSVAAIQLAKRWGATIVASTRSDAKIEIARGLGADVVVNNRTTDVVAATKEATAGRGADIAFDHVGPALFQASLLSLRARGRLVFCGSTSGDEATFNLPYAYHFGLRLLGSDPYSYAEFGDMLEFYWRNHIEPVVADVMPLEKVGEAQRRMEASEFAGKIVVCP